MLRWDKQIKQNQNHVLASERNKVVGALPLLPADKNEDTRSKNTGVDRLHGEAMKTQGCFWRRSCNPAKASGREEPTFAEEDHVGPEFNWTRFQRQSLQRELNQPGELVHQQLEEVESFRTQGNTAVMADTQICSRLHFCICDIEDHLRSSQVIQNSPMKRFLGRFLEVQARYYWSALVDLKKASVSTGYDQVWQVYAQDSISPIYQKFPSMTPRLLLDICLTRPEMFLHKVMLKHQRSISCLLSWAVTECAAT